MFEHIRKDILRYHSTSGSLMKKDVFRIVWHQAGLKSLIVYRMGRWIRSTGGYPACWPIALLMIPIYWLLISYVRLAYDIYLTQSSCIRPGLYIGHYGGIRLRKCQLGANCSIQQEVCLEPGKGSESGPIIGSRVWIGSHAKIRGEIRVGDRATIGAGAVVEHDVPDGCLLLGNPARIVFRNYDNSRYL